MKQVGFGEVKITPDTLKDTANTARLKALDTDYSTNLKNLEDKKKELAKAKEVAKGSDHYSEGAVAARHLEDEVSNLTHQVNKYKGLADTLANADSMSTLKNELMNQRKMFGMRDTFNRVSVTAKLDDIGFDTNSGALKNALDSNDMNRVLSHIDSVESSTRVAVDDALKTMDDGKLTNVIGGELEQMLRINPDANLSNLTPEQLKTIAQVKGIDAVADLVEPVIMGGAYGATGLAGLAGLNMLGVIGNEEPPK